MIINDIYINNVEPHKKLHLESLSKFNVLVGPNNSGKSLTLEAISKLLFYNTNQVSDTSKKLYFEENDVYSITWSFNASIDEFYGGVDKTMNVLQTLKPELKEIARKNGITNTLEYVIKGHSGGLQNKGFRGVFLGEKHLFADENYIEKRIPDAGIRSFW